MKPPRQFFQPLAIGAPAPMRELPVRLERMIHFVPPHIEKMRAKVPDLVAQVDVVLGNLEDAIPIDAKQAARDGFIAMAKATDFGTTGLWTRINASTRPGRSTTSSRSSAPSATSSTSSCCPRSTGPGTSTISTSSWRSSKRATRSRSRS